MGGTNVNTGGYWTYGPQGKSWTESQHRDATKDESKMSSENKHVIGSNTTGNINLQDVVNKQIDSKAINSQNMNGDKTTVVDKSAVKQRGPIFQRRHNTVTTSPMKQIKDKELDTFEINVTKDKAPDGFNKNEKTEGTRVHKDGKGEKIGGSRTVAGNF